METFAQGEVAVMILLLVMVNVRVLVTIMALLVKHVYLTCTGRPVIKVRIR